MVLFCRYGFRAFNFQNTLDNFYARQHKDGFICREIRESDGSDAFQRFDPSSAGINIFPWAEWEYFCNVNDPERLTKIFPVLLANYQWYSTYRTWPDGSYFSSGWGCGMDNQPRLPKGFNPAFSHGHMSWIDATLQQIYAGKILIRMAQILNRTEDVKEINKEVSDLALYVNSKMWDSEKALYVDRFRDGNLSDVKTIGTFWALLADVVPGNEMSRFLAHLSDTTEFNRPHRVPSLSADNPTYDPQGGYWLGAVWAMTNYTVLRGLTEVGADSLAYEIARNHLNNVTGIFNKTGIIWENYSPEFLSGSGKKNFVGEGGLTGTAILLEYIFGIRSDVPSQTMVWDIRLTDEFGVKQYPFGKQGIVNLYCKKRKNIKDEPSVKVNSNVPFRLKIIWSGGSKIIDVKADKLPLTAQEKETGLTIEMIMDGSDPNPAAWLQIQSKGNDNINGWYKEKGPKGFPAFSPVKVKVPEGEVTITATSSNSDEVTKKVNITHGIPASCKLTLISRYNLHKTGYFSFDSHNHLDGDEEKNCPPFIYPYCAAMGIDHIDVCQLWFLKLGLPVGYDSIVRYFKESSTPALDLRFGAESPKLRYGHTWYVNHPGLADPLGDYLKWHDAAYFNSLVKKDSIKSGTIDLRGTLHPEWHPPFVDRLRAKAQGAFAAAAHPTRWWHQGMNEIYPATNTSADLAFDLLAAQSYDGIVIAGDNKDNIFYQNLWFNILNLGYRITPVAETDGNIADGSLGNLAVTYVWTCKEQFDRKSLIDNLLAGHTMLSAKAVMLLTVDGKLPPGSVLPADGKDHLINVEVFSEPASDEYISYLVLYRNGKVAEKLDFRGQKKRGIRHEFIVSDTETSWYVVKSYGKVFPKNDLQFDVMAYAEKCSPQSDNDYAANTGVSMTAPVFFNAPGWQPPKPVISSIHGKILDKEGHPLKKMLVSIWNIDDKLADLTTDDEGNFEIEAPATIDIRYTLPDSTKEQQWLFYEYPPLLDLIEDTYTISWAKKYPGIRGGQMPWEAFHYNEIQDVLRDIRWTIRLN